MAKAKNKEDYTLDPTTEARIGILEKELVEKTEKLNNLEHFIKEATKAPTEAPDVTAARLERAQLLKQQEEPGGLTFDGRERVRLLSAKIATAELEDCVFVMDGQRYQIVLPAIILNGQRYTAPEMMDNVSVLRQLVAQGSGAVKLIS
jgi:hypothetical protein